MCSVVFPPEANEKENSWPHDLQNMDTKLLLENSKFESWAQLINLAV